eukprot:COSAG05_NODE_359_length_10803_cov_14.909193_7_plen_50_part_00
MAIYILMYSLMDDVDAVLGCWLPHSACVAGGALPAPVTGRFVMLGGEAH